MSPAKSLSKSFAEKENVLSQKTKAYEYERKQFEFINKVGQMKWVFSEGAGDGRAKREKGEDDSTIRHSCNGFFI